MSIFIMSLLFRHDVITCPAPKFSVLPKMATHNGVTSVPTNGITCIVITTNKG